ncbi:MAG: hypothetical protein WC690_03980, partial [bacterium]
MKRLFIALAVIIILCAAAVAGMRHAARAARDAIERQRHDILGLAIDVGSYDIDWRGAALALRGIKIYPAGHEDEGSLLASADELRVLLAPRDMLKKTLHAREVVLVRPKLAVIHNKDGSYNWSCLNLGGEKPKEPVDVQAKKKEQWRVIVDAVRMEGGEAQYRGLVKGHRLDLTNLEL